MRIEIFFLPGCPNYEPAVDRLKKVLAAEALSIDIQRIPVHTDEEAIAYMFPGSPTIRVNGNDVEAEEMNVPSMTCRLYANRTGVPSEEVLRLAMSKAKREV